MESLAFESVNLECEKILGPLKARSALMDELILNIMTIKIFDCYTKSWIGEAISKVMRRHQNAKCFNCGRTGHLRREGRQGVPRNNVSSRNVKNKRYQHSGLC